MGEFVRPGGGPGGGGGGGGTDVHSLKISPAMQKGAKTMNPCPSWLSRAMASEHDLQGRCGGRGVEIVKGESG